MIRYNNKKLLVLGSNFGAKDIVKLAKKKGLYVIVADYYETTPAKEVADEKWLISTTDIDELEKKCREEHIDGIVTGVGNIKYCRDLCKRLNLPIYCENDNAFELSTNKRRFKDLCKEVGAPIATDYLISDIDSYDLDSIDYPVVVKPIDCASNVGMSYVSKKEELKKAFLYAQSCAKDPSTIIVERQLRGHEFAVHYYIVDGEPELMFYTMEHHEPGEMENLYSIINTTSFLLKQYKKDVDEKIKEVFRKAGCTNGPAWIEIMHDEDGKFYVLEMGYRFCAELINIPYKDINGFDSLNWMIDFALGNNIEFSDLPERLNYHDERGSGTYYLFGNKKETIASIKGVEKLEEFENITFDFSKTVGDEVVFHRPMGEIRFSYENIQQLCDLIKFVNENIFVTDSNGQNLFIRYTDFDSLKLYDAIGLAENKDS